MRLLHTRGLYFEEFTGDQVPRYAILSHRWGSLQEEVAYVDFVDESKKTTPGFSKIVGFCNLASRRGLDYCWIDTCCIDKRNSAELTEAINSMFNWYARAEECYSYLSVIYDDSKSKIENLRASTLFSRSWTLQELLAPPEVLFFDVQWRLVGTRHELRYAIERVSGIRSEVLTQSIVGRLNKYSVAERMSWAADREASRAEDVAYSLLGLFSVNMPLLYGEETRAFRRLQEEILARTEDDSLLAWGKADTFDYETKSMLASSPRQFRDCGEIIAGFNSQRVLFECTSKGMLISIHRSFNPKFTESILRRSRAFNDALTIDLGCYRPSLRYQSRNLPAVKDMTDTLALTIKQDPKTGKWRRAGVTSHLDKDPSQRFRKHHYSAYDNDYVRLYVHNDWST